MTGVPPLEAGIAKRRITSDGWVFLPPRIAAWIEKHAGMTADRRMRLRGSDHEAYIAFASLHLAALRSDSGTESCVGQRNKGQSESWMSTSEAAEALGVTDRCIRKWCNTGRIHAVMTGGRWLVNPNTIALQNIA